MNFPSSALPFCFIGKYKVIMVIMLRLQLLFYNKCNYMRPTVIVSWFIGIITQNNETINGVDINSFSHCVKQILSDCIYFFLHCVLFFSCNIKKCNTPVKLYRWVDHMTCRVHKKSENSGGCCTSYRHRTRRFYHLVWKYSAV